MEKVLHTLLRLLLKFGKSYFNSIISDKFEFVNVKAIIKFSCTLISYFERMAAECVKT